MRTRLKDIARRVGCSLQTVSLVMNGKYSGRVAEARAREVRKAAEEMGYVVNFSAGCLRGKRSHAVGVIQPAVSPGGFPDLAATVARHLQKRGYQVYFYIQDSDGTNREAITSLVSRGVEGVILLDCYNIVPHRGEHCPILAVGSMAHSEISVDKRSGVRVPEDVAVLGFDGLNFGEFSQIPLATVVQPFELLGRRSVEIMLERIAGREPARKTELLAPAFRPGPSCGCPLPHEPVLPMVEWLGLSYDQSDPVYAGELAGFVSPNQHPRKWQIK